MDRQYIDDRHVVARYLADQLSDQEREEFEAFCAGNPEVFGEIEATARFKAGLARLKESGELEAAIARRPGIGSFAMRHAASLAAAISMRDQLKGKKVVGILSGGNIPLERFAAVTSGASH